MQTSEKLSTRCHRENLSKITLNMSHNQYLTRDIVLRAKLFYSPVLFSCWQINYFAPVGVQRNAMSVCMSVCLLAYLMTKLHEIFCGH